MVKTLDVRVANTWMDGDSLYVISNEWSELSEGFSTGTYKIINTKTMEVVNECFIADGTDAKIKKPYGIAVNPITKDILLADAYSYVDYGFLYCFSPDGNMKWRIRAGNIPAHFVFLGDNINEQ